MPAYIFNSCASNTKVGVFTKAESLTIFPEYANLAAPPGCGSSKSSWLRTQQTYKMTCSPNDDLDQPVHPRSLIIHRLALKG